MMNTVKVEKSEFEQLKRDVHKDRAISVFNDMKIFLDTTVNQFEERMISEREMTHSVY